MQVLDTSATSNDTIESNESAQETAGAKTKIFFSGDLQKKGKGRIGWFKKLFLNYVDVICYKELQRLGHWLNKQQKLRNLRKQIF